MIRAPVADGRGKFADDEARDMRAPGFNVDAVHAVIADQRIGHRHDLSLVGWIRENFLVTGHRGVEADFAARRSARAKTRAGKHRAGGKSENGFHPCFFRSASSCWMNFCGSSSMVGSASSFAGMRPISFPFRSRRSEEHTSELQS